MFYESKMFLNIVESEEHFLLNCKEYYSLRKNSKFISETVHDLGKGAD